VKPQVIIKGVNLRVMSPPKSARSDEAASQVRRRMLTYADICREVRAATRPPCRFADVC
jgi:hypothetical protein